MGTSTKEGKKKKIVHKEKPSTNSSAVMMKPKRKKKIVYDFKRTYRYLNHQSHPFLLLGCGEHPWLSPIHRS